MTCKRLSYLVLSCCLSLFVLPDVAQAGCPGGEMCARSDVLTMRLSGVGPVEGNLFGFTDTLYGAAGPDEVARGALDGEESAGSCKQPSLLTDQRFEFAGFLPGVGAVRLYLDPRRPSRGEVVPAEIPDRLPESPSRDGAFPAVNEMRFFLHLDLPDMGESGMQLVNVEPLIVRAPIREWPPPVGTVYELDGPVEFAERDPKTGKAVGPVRATIAQESISCFQGTGPLEVSLEAGESKGRAPVRLHGGIRSDSREELETIWHLYTRGRLVTLDSKRGKGEGKLGPQAGSVTVGGQDRSSARIQARVKFRRPGSEFVTFMAAASDPGREFTTECDQRIFGSQADLRVTQPDRGLLVSRVKPEVVEAGSEVALEITGEGFEQPLKLSFSGSGIELLGVERVSEERLRAKVRVGPEAAPTLRDLRIGSGKREFHFTEAVTVLWPPPVVHSVKPTTLANGPVELKIEGEFFPALTSVGLGPQVKVLGVDRQSRRHLVVQAEVSGAAEGSADVADVIVVGANGTGGLRSGLTFGDSGPSAAP